MARSLFRVFDLLRTPPVRNKSCELVQHHKFLAGSAYRHLISTQLFGRDDLAMVAVFDGHRGNETACYLEQNMRKIIEDGCSLPLTPNQISHIIMKKDSEYYHESGSTIACALVEHKQDTDEFQILAWNVGDARVVLGKAIAKEPEQQQQQQQRQGTSNQQQQDVPAAQKNTTYEAIRLSIDHKPSLQSVEYPHNIGLVETTRLHFVPLIATRNHNLSLNDLSRAFGDSHEKTYICRPDWLQPVTCLPSFFSTIAKKDDFLLVFCDGVVEGLDDEDVVQIVGALLDQKRNEGVAIDPKEICAKLLDIAVQTSDDNLSAILVLFGQEALESKRESTFVQEEHDANNFKSVGFSRSYRDFSLQFGDESHKENILPPILQLLEGEIKVPSSTEKKERIPNLLQASSTEEAQPLVDAFLYAVFKSSISNLTPLLPPLTSHQIPPCIFIDKAQQREQFRFRQQQHQQKGKTLTKTTMPIPTGEWKELANGTLYWEWDYKPYPYFLRQISGTKHLWDLLATKERNYANLQQLVENHLKEQTDETRRAIVWYLISTWTPIGPKQWELIAHNDEILKKTLEVLNKNVVFEG